MDNKALYDFINEACKQDDTDIDISIAELTSAIHTLETEREKRENKKRNILIDNFKKAYLALCENNVHVAYDFDAKYVRKEQDDYYYEDDIRLDLDDFCNFVFD